jgi:hypothetical protein
VRSKPKKPHLLLAALRRKSVASLGRETTPPAAVGFCTSYHIRHAIGGDPPTLGHNHLTMHDVRYRTEQLAIGRDNCQLVDDAQGELGARNWHDLAQRRGG